MHQAESTCVSGTTILLVNNCETRSILYSPPLHMPPAVLGPLGVAFKGTV